VEDISKNPIRIGFSAPLLCNSRVHYW